MKKQIETFKYQLMLVFFLLFNATMALAQDGGGAGNATDGSVTVSKTTTTTSSTTMQDWYTQPWVWIVGGLVFILLLIALVRGGGSSRTDVHRTTIRRDVSTD